jgi:hypothetical protein
MSLFKKYFPLETTSFQSWATFLLGKGCIVASMFTAATLSAQMDEVNFGGEYLFRRAFEHSNDTKPNLDESYKVLQIIHERALPGVDFGLDWNPILSSHFENLGIGSAMALDFLARYINECGNLTDNEISLYVREFEPYYTIQTPIFVAREHAFENVDFPDPWGVNSEIVKYRKLQSIANYHDIKLEPVTNSLKRKDIKNGKANFKKIIDDFPVSTYVIRALDPAPVGSKEYGHTMILVKNKDFSIFYDCNEGAAKINKASGKLSIKLGEYIVDFLIELPFSEFRVYKATCSKECCTNLSSEMVVEGV